MSLLTNNAKNPTVNLQTGYWLHGIEFISCDASTKSVYWKGQLIDFVSDPNGDRHKEYINVLAARCKHLEAIQVPINIETVVHFGDWFSTMHNDYQYKTLLMNCPNIYVSGKSKIILVKGDRVVEYNNKKWRFYCTGSLSDTEWSWFFGQEACVKRGYEELSLSYSDLDSVNQSLEYFNVPVDLFD